MFPNLLVNTGQAYLFHEVTPWCVCVCACRGGIAGSGPLGSNTYNIETFYHWMKQSCIVENCIIQVVSTTVMEMENVQREVNLFLSIIIPPVGKK